jgi:hypothetical protein
MIPNTNNIQKDLFKSAEFWMQKGYLIQTSSRSTPAGFELTTAKNTSALDYYLSGVKIDPFHVGCAYNVACTFYEEKMFCNSLKWFNLANRL